MTAIKEVVFGGEVGVGEITADGQSQRDIPQQNEEELLPFFNRNGTFCNLMTSQSRSALQILADVKWVHAQQPTMEHFKGRNRAAASRCVWSWEFRVTNGCPSVSCTANRTSGKCLTLSTGSNEEAGVAAGI